MQADKRTSTDGIKERKKRVSQKELDAYDDDDVKRELRKGHTAILYRISTAISILASKQVQ